MEVALLLGQRTETKVSRHERLRHIPPLRTALAYEVILGSPVAVIFAGMFRTARGEVRLRARRMLKLLAAANVGPEIAVKKGSLQRILAE